MTPVTASGLSLTLRPPSSALRMTADFLTRSLHLPLDPFTGFPCLPKLIRTLQPLETAKLNLKIPQKKSFASLVALCPYPYGEERRSQNLCLRRNFFGRKCLDRQTCQTSWGKRNLSDSNILSYKGLNCRDSTPSLGSVMLCGNACALIMSIENALIMRRQNKSFLVSSYTHCCRHGMKHKHLHPSIHARRSCTQPKRRWTWKTRGTTHAQTSLQAKAFNRWQLGSCLPMSPWCLKGTYKQASEAAQFTASDLLSQSQLVPALSFFMLFSDIELTTGSQAGKHGH